MNESPRLLECRQLHADERGYGRRKVVSHHFIDGRRHRDPPATGGAGAALGRTGVVASRICAVSFG
jgi:hypothetical protein